VRSTHRQIFIHPSAIVEDGATLGSNVTIGPYTIVHKNVSVGSDSIIESHCVIGRSEPGIESQPLTIGRSSIVRSHTVVYGGSTIGSGLQTGHGAIIREASKIGERCRVGTQADIEGSVTIGDYVSIHSSVFVAPDATIGNFVWLFPRVVLTNDPHPPSAASEGITIEDYAAVAANAVILPGVRLGHDCVVAAGAVVTTDVRAGAIVAGVPATERGDASEIRLRSTAEAAYPWRRHFRAGYPDDVAQMWMTEFGEGRH
jgi:acetyltransferase-like isoleucine patch superfamily enzyme